MRHSIYRVKLIFLAAVIVIGGTVLGGAKYLGDRTTEVLGTNTESSLLDKFSYLDGKADLLNYDGPSKNMYLSNARYVKVLVYHGIVESPDGENVEWEKFRDQMFALKREGYETIKMRDLYAYLNGRETLPDKSFMLTFDDGRKDSYYPVDPVLKALNYSAVMFVISDRTEKSSNFHLSREELTEMHTSGRWNIEVHAGVGHSFIMSSENGNRSHYYSNKMWLSDSHRFETDQEYGRRVSSDIAMAKRDIDKLFSISTIGFAVPYGDYGQGENNFREGKTIFLDAARKQLPLLFYQTWDNNDTKNYPLLNAFMVKRLEVDPDWSGSDLLAIMNM